MAVIIIGKLAVQRELQDGTRELDEVMDFFIDATPLSELLGINRGDMAYIDDDFTTPKIRTSIIQHAIGQYIGLGRAYNQFNSSRLVLYRCHCGSDYCGVVSFGLAIDDRRVIWKDIAFESDFPTHQFEPYSIGSLEFEKAQYLNEFEAFSKIISESTS